MSRLDLLLRTVATALDVPEGSVEASWTRLRKAGLWTPVGRGRVRPDPTPADATNLLLSFLVGGLATDTPEKVPIVRQSEGIPFDATDPIAVEERLAFVGLMDLPDTTLGTALDATLSQLAVAGELEINEAWWVHRVTTAKKHELVGADRRIRGGEIEVHRSWLGWETIIEFNIVPYAVQLHAVGPIDFLYRARNPAERLATETDPQRALDYIAKQRRGYPRRSASERVSYDALRAIGACLRGDGDRVREILSRPELVIEAADPARAPGIVHYFGSGEIEIVAPDSPSVAKSRPRRP